jgi:hypothetical protein
MQKINYMEHDYEYTEMQTAQQTQVAGLRSFYCSEAPFPVRELDEVVFFEEPAVIKVPDSELSEVCKWLRRADVWLAFKPAVYEENVLVLR